VKQKNIVIIGLYVDDLLVIGANQEMVDELFIIASKMDIKNLGQASMVIGMHVIQNEDGVTFDQ
jgi:predicted HTH transcriptional regulator